MRVLVAVATRHGATAEIAAEISVGLRHAIPGWAIHVDQLAIDQVASLDQYDAVIIGSAIYGGRWLSPAVDFAAQRKDELRRMPLWLFSSGPVGDLTAPGQPAADQVESIASDTNAIEHRVFGGKIDYHDLDQGEHFAVRVMGIADGDFRDWAAVRAWVATIVERLSPLPTTQTG